MRGIPPCHRRSTVVYMIALAVVPPAMWLEFGAARFPGA